MAPGGETGRGAGRVKPAGKREGGRAAAIAAAVTLGYALLFGRRTDYAGHYMAGFGATLVLLAVPFAFAKKPLGWTAVAAAIALIAFGIYTEATWFQLAIFDPVDFCNQSLGACMAGLCLAGGMGSEELGIELGFWGLLLITGGFAYAYS